VENAINYALIHARLAQTVFALIVIQAITLQIAYAQIALLAAHLAHHLQNVLLVVQNIH
jgi:hypothetical protein